MSRTIRRRHRPTVRHPRLTLAGLLGALLLSALAATVPDSTAALVAQLSNTANTVSTRPYFTCAGAIAADSPRIYFKLNDTNGNTATDSSGQGTNGSYRGTTTKGVAGACVRDTGSAVTVAGSTGYVSTTTLLSAPTTYSVSAWFKTTNNTGGLLAGFGAASTGASAITDRVLYLTSTGALAFGTNNLAKTTIIAPGVYGDGKWHHAMATLGASGMRLYVDGSQAASSSTTATLAYTGSFRVGYDNLSGWTSAPTTGFNGTLDEVAFFPTTLTDADAAAQYGAGI